MPDCAKVGIYLGETWLKFDRTASLPCLQLLEMVCLSPILAVTILLELGTDLGRSGSGVFPPNSWFPFGFHKNIQKKGPGTPIFWTALTGLIFRAPRRGLWPCATGVPAGWQALGPARQPLRAPQRPGWSQTAKPPHSGGLDRECFISQGQFLGLSLPLGKRHLPTASSFWWFWKKSRWPWRKPGGLSIYQGDPSTSPQRKPMFISLRQPLGLSLPLGKRQNGCGSKLGSKNGLPWYIEPRTKPSVPWWFNFDPYPNGTGRCAQCRSSQQVGVLKLNA